jgi:predicted dehydrogenase
VSRYDSHRHGSVHMSRRRFIASAALGVATAAVSWPRRAKAAVGANDRLGIALIGQGEMGTIHRHLLKKWRDAKQNNVDVVHVCDVYRRRLDVAASDLGIATKSMDYRRVLDDKNVDIVLIATPDHWHHKIAREAMEAGKDVYVEKPMCHTIPQAKDLVATQRRTGRVVQVGPQSTSNDVYGKVAAEIAKGAIGPVVLITSSYARNGTAGEWRNYGLRLPGGLEGVDMDAKPGPDLDWDMWLGWKWDLAPRHEWHPSRFFQFRCYWDYSGGIATDLFFHQLAHILKAANLKFPERATGNGGIFVFGPQHTTPQGWKDDREVPDTYSTTIDYPGGPTVVMAASMGSDRGITEEIRGHLGTVIYTAEGAVIEPQGINSGAEAIHIKRTRNGSEEDHWANFIECVRNRTPEKCDCSIDLGYCTNVAISMGTLSYRQQKVFKWDAQKEEAGPA